MSRPNATYAETRPYFAIFQLDPLVNKFDWNRPVELHKRRSIAEQRTAQLNAAHPEEVARYLTRRVFI